MLKVVKKGLELITDLTNPLAGDRLGQELISGAEDRVKVFGVARFCFEFSAQLQYMVVDGTSRRIILVSPHLTQKLFPRDHPSTILDQVHQSLKLLLGESNRPPLTTGFHGGTVHPHVPKHKVVGGARSSRPGIRPVRRGGNFREIVRGIDRLFQQRFLVINIAAETYERCL